MHCSRLSDRRTSFILMFILTVLLFACKIIVGYISNSMALIADSFHMLSDLVVLAVGYSALHFAINTKFSDSLDSAYTFGRVRAEILGGLINAVFLVAFCFSISVEALKRFVVTEHLERPFPVLIVGVTSLLVNLVGLFLFYQRRRRRPKFSSFSTVSAIQRTPPESKTDTESSEATNEALQSLAALETEKKNFIEKKTTEHSSWAGAVSHPHEMNKEGVYLHILNHVLSSSMIVLSSLVVMLVKAKWTAYIDPVITILVVIIVLISTFPLIKEAILIFMQSVPADLKTQDLEQRLLSEIPALLGVHEFHVWQLAGHQIIASAHILLESPVEYDDVSKMVKDFFQEEGIYHVTLQPEFKSVSPDLTISGSDECLLVCSKDQSCKDLTCCIKNTVPDVQTDNT